MQYLNQAKIFLNRILLPFISKRFNEISCKRYFAFILTFLALFLSTFSYSQTKEADKFVVVIDAGHGGHDSGTRGVTSKEKDVALSIALKTGGYIEKYLEDVKVVYTRKTDVFVELDERARIANSINADLFISIHVDGVAKKSVYGTSTFAMGLHVNDENLAVAKRENAVILKEEDYESRYAGFNPESPESYIRISLEQNTYLDLSLSLAAKVQDQFKNRVSRKSRGVKQAGFVVLWQTTMPSVLIETGFLTNVKEEKYLNSEYGQDMISSAIFRAFRDYKNEISAHSVKDPENLIISDKSVSEKEVVFRIQIAASKEKINLKHRKYRLFEGIEETKEGDLYKYLLGSKDNYDEIVKLHFKVKKKIKDSFIVAYNSGKKISVEEAKKLIESNK